MINRQNFLMLFVMVVLLSVVAWTIDVWPFSSLKVDQSEARSMQGADGAALSPNSEVVEKVPSSGPAKNLPTNTPISTSAAGNANGLRSIPAHPSKPRESSQLGADPSHVKNFPEKESRDDYPQSSISDRGAKTYASAMATTVALASEARASATTEIPPARSMDVAVEVPIGEEVPLVLVPVDEADGFTPEDLAMINAEADKFIVETSQEGTVTQPDPILWESNRQKSDELFRTWYGNEAYMAMQKRRYFESRQPNNP